MISLAAFALAAVQQPFDHARHHPRTAGVYIECPDVPAALKAYEHAPMSRLIGDDAVGEVSDRLAKLAGFDLAAGLASALAPLGVTSADSDDPLGEVLAGVRTAQSFSLSFGIDEREPGEAKRSMDELGQALAALDRMAERIETHSREHGAPPESLAALEAPPESSRDPWGRSFVYSVESDGSFRLATLGRDGAPGGAGVDADLRFDQDLSQLLAEELERRMAGCAVVRFATEALAAQAQSWLERVAPLAADSTPAPGGWTRYRLQAGGGAQRTWLARSGATLVAGYGATALEDVAKRVQGALPSLDIAASWRRLEQHHGPQRGSIVLRGWGDGGIAQELGADSSTGPRGFAGTSLAQLSGLAGAWRMQLNDGRFSTDVLWDVPRDESLFGLIGAGPAPREAFDYVPSDSVGFFAVQLDSEAVRARVSRMLAADEGAQAPSRLEALEAEHGFDLDADLCANLQGGAAGYLLPITGVGLPNVGLVARVRDAAAFERGVRGLFKALGEVEGADYTVRESKYRDAPLWTVNFNAEGGGSPMAAFVPTPTITIVKDRVIVSLTSLRAKKEIKRALGEDDGPHAVASDASRFPADAGFSGWMDWAATIDGLYGMGRSVAAMFGGQLDLPMDLGALMTSLPDSSRVFTRFFEPTTLSIRSVEGGYALRWDSSFGPETWLSLGGLLFGATGTSQVTRVEGVRTSAVDPAETGASDEAVLRDATLSALRALGTRITVFRLDQARLPESLDELGRPTASYPRGFLEGLDALEDAWGGAFLYQRSAAGDSYRLWSAGPNRLDDDGGGDDLLAP